MRRTWVTLPIVRGGIGALFWLTVSALAQQNVPDLTTQSLEDLMNIQVTSVSKKGQKISRTAAAVFVITQEEIRRSGAINIPDLLRLTPGLNVAQINANLWAVSARGFNGEFSNKLLVLLDGRSVYLPTFSGVFWDILDVPLEDIERIEVIRGPGGTTWGANAVNGVINIISKKASATPGAMVVSGGGNLTQGFGTTQYGGKGGRSIDYRLFTKYSNQYHMPGTTGADGGDGWHTLRGGFRADSRISCRDDLMMEGDLYTGRIGDLTTALQSVATPILQAGLSETNVAGGYIQTSWNHRYSSHAETILQLSFDNYERNDVLGEERNTLNLDFEHHLGWGERQDLVWGVGYRYSSSTTNGHFSFSLNPADLNTQLVSSFLQDEIAIVPERLSLTMGSKLEHNYFTGFGVMPSGRVAWNLTERQMIWAAVSRVIRTPSDVDTGMNLNAAGFVPPTGPPVLIRVVGNPKFQDEKLVAYEAGYRRQVRNQLSIDIASYYNSYDGLQTTEAATPFFETTPFPPHLVLPFTHENLMSGETHGAELSANWRVNERWMLTSGYALELVHLRLDPASQDIQSLALAQGSTPRHWAHLESHLNLTRSLTWDASANFADHLAGLNVPSYTRADTQLNWHAGEHVSLSLVGQDLLKDRHQEFFNPQGTGLSSLVKRKAFAKITWNF